MLSTYNQPSSHHSRHTMSPNRHSYHRWPTSHLSPIHNHAYQKYDNCISEDAWTRHTDTGRTSFIIKQCTYQQRLLLMVEQSEIILTSAVSASKLQSWASQTGIVCQIITKVEDVNGNKKIVVSKLGVFHRYILCVWDDRSTVRRVVVDWV